MTATLPVCVRGIAMSPHIIVVINVTRSNYHKPFLSSIVDGGLSSSSLKAIPFLHTRQSSEQFSGVEFIY